MDPRTPGSFPPGGSQPPYGQPTGQAGGPGQPGFGGGGFGPTNPNAYAPPGYGNNPYGNPYGDPRFPQQPPKKSRWWLWLLLGGGGVMALLCCGLVGLVFVGFGALESSVRADLNDDPVVQEHIGDVQSADLDIMQMADEPPNENGESPLVFTVKGTKGEGVVIGEQGTDDRGNPKLLNGRLRLPGGEDIPLSD